MLEGLLYLVLLILLLLLGTGRE